MGEHRNNARGINTFGRYLRQLRKNAGLTQRRFGLAVGYSESQVNKLERGTRLPDPEIVATAFLRVLKLSRQTDAAKQLIALSEAAHRQALLTGTKSRQGNLPIALTSFIGREGDVKQLLGLLLNERLLTLVGPGGCGKTRLALEVAGQSGHQFDHGIWFIELAPLADASALVQTVCDVLRVVPAPLQDPDQALLAFLVDRNALLVLDNCEHMVEHCAALAGTLLRACPNLKIVATSREALSVPGEKRWPVPSLDVPPQPQENSVHLATPQSSLREYGAVQLFIERARSVDDSVRAFETHESLQAIGEICRRLDGLPLAIELAAARTSVFAVEDIRDRLNERFQLLIGGNRLATARQYSLRAAIEWSIALLSEVEKCMLRALSIFAGGFTVAAAEAVTTCQGILPRESVTHVLTALVEKSLVQKVADLRTGPTMRFGLLETIRQYAQNELMPNPAWPSWESLRASHAAWYLQLAEDAEMHLFRHEQVKWLRWLDIDLDNIRASLAFFIETGDEESAKRLVGALRRFWQTRGHASEGRVWLARVLAVPAAQTTSAIAHAKAFFTAATLANYQGDMDSRKAMLERAIAYVAQTQDPWLVGQVLGGIVSKPSNHDEYLEIRLRLEAVRSSAQHIGNDWLLGNAYHKMATLELDNGDNATSQNLFRQSLRHLSASGDKIYSMLTHKWLGNISLKLGDYKQAELDYIAALRIVKEAGLDYAEHIGVWYCLRGLGELAAHRHQPLRMSRLLGVVEKEQESQGGMPTFWFSHLNQRAGAALYEAITREPIDMAEYQAAWNAGRMTTLEEAIDYVIELSEANE
jgi:predicted ATPase/transcriptional regulator with XRE-family HTH domain